MGQRICTAFAPAIGEYSMAITAHVLQKYYSVERPPVALDARASAAFIGVSERKFQYLRAQDPSFPSGRQIGPKKILFIVDELDAWIRSQPVAEIPKEPAQLKQGRVFKNGRPVAV
jgi:predicted DNA-binding transcriptional regulator AlpA